MYKALLLLLFSATSLLAQQYKITAIQVTGSNRYSAEQVEKAAGLKVGEFATLDAVRDAAQSLINSGAFAQVEYRHAASPGGMKVQLSLEDKPDKEFIGCDFQNLVWFPEDELLAKLQEHVPLFWGKVPMTGNLPEIIARELTSMLQEKGVAGHVSASAETDRAGNTSGFEFNVDDVELHIAQIVFEGASPDLSRELAEAARSLVGLTYHRSTVEGFVQKQLKNIYLQKGFLQAAFGPPVASIAAQQGGDVQVRISLAVTEGPMYRFGKVQWSGVKAMPPEKAAAIVPTPAGFLVNGVKLQQSLRILRGLYANSGYLHMLLKAKPDFHPESRTVDYSMEVDEGPLFSMGKLEFEGLTAQSEEKLRQLWKMREGEPFNEQYFREFFKTFRLPNGAAYVVDKTEGERPNTVDITIRFCNPNNPCRPAESHLYEPPAEEESQ
jgi:outer membrane protein insertion porin family